MSASSARKPVARIYAKPRLIAPLSTTCVISDPVTSFHLQESTDQDNVSLPVAIVYTATFDPVIVRAFVVVNDNIFDPV